MALSKSFCPVLSRRYHHYLGLESPILWSRYRFSSPYWTRYHHEFERMRTSMLVQQDLIDEMLDQIRAARVSRESQSSRISSCVAKCESITRSLREDSRSISMIESEMESWQKAVSEMHSTMSSLKSRTETMGSKIESLKNDFDKTSFTLETEFNIEALLAEMEEKRRKAEEECQRIYDSLNLNKTVQLDSWCPICKANNCVYATKEPTPAPTPVPTPPPTPPPANICEICGAEDCQYGKDTRCKVCGSTDCDYQSTALVGLVEEPEPELIVEAPMICEICGAENCTYGDSTPEVKVCDVCFKENCPYFVNGSF